MRNFAKLLFRRVVLVSLGILLQLVTMVLFMFWLAELRPWFSTLMVLLRIFFVVYLVSSHIDPSYKIAWLILILAAPVAGVSIYLFMGGNRLSRREKQKLQRLQPDADTCLPEDPAVRTRLEADAPGCAGQSLYLYRSAGSPLCGGTFTEYFPCGEGCFPRMLEELRQAQRYIFLEYFIVEEGKMWGEILSVLIERAKAGVDVRLIYDDFGCITRLPARYPRLLQDFGISARVFNPYLPVVSGRLNNRDHRKMMIIDGRTAFTGGLNLADEYINIGSRFGYWKDAGLLLRGQGVWPMTVQFLTMWSYVSGTACDFREYLPTVTGNGSGFVQPFCDSPLDQERVGQTVLLNMINRAERRVYIMTPYLVLDDRVTTALCNAAKSGLDVRIITPGIGDKWYVHAMTRANYMALTAAGVRIFEFVPGFLHSKVFLADSRTAVVGTVNLDYRSLYLHFENGVWMHEADCIRSIADDFERTFEQSREITRTMAQSVSLPVRLGRSLMMLFAPLM